MNDYMYIFVTLRYLFRIETADSAQSRGWGLGMRQTQALPKHNHNVRVMYKTNCTYITWAPCTNTRHVELYANQGLRYTETDTWIHTDTYRHKHRRTHLPRMTHCHMRQLLQKFFLGSLSCSALCTICSLAIPLLNSFLWPYRSTRLCKL